MEENKENKYKFKSLTPVRDGDNVEIYNNILDSYFDDDLVHNVAIFGGYGSGKSTVWNRYVKKKLDEDKDKAFENIITVSLGDYTKVNNVENDNNIKKLSSDKMNRVEKDIIDNIKAQVDPKKIPSSDKLVPQSHKYLSVLLNSFSISILLTLMFLFIKLNMSEYSIETMLIIAAGLFIILNIPIAWLLKGSKYYIEELNFGGNKLKKNENDDKYKTVLDRDREELLYILKNSDSRILVFEDLDRYNNIEIFDKIKKINILINHMIETENKKTGKKEKPFKFIYMTRENIFAPYDKAKFFEGILSIVPVMNSGKTYEYIYESLDELEFKPDKRTVKILSYYINDIRLANAIINDYIVYSKTIRIKELDLDPNKLFGIIVFKNLRPQEFSNLINSKGDLYAILKNNPEYRKILYDKIKKSIIEFSEEKKNKQKELADKLYEYLDKRYNGEFKISLYSRDSEHFKPDISEQVQKQYLEYFVSLKEKKIFILLGESFIQTYSLQNLMYYFFVEKKLDNDLKEKQILEKKINEIQALSMRISNYIRRGETLSRYSSTALLNIFRKEVLSVISEKIINDELITLIIAEGFIDETYQYYTLNSKIINKGNEIYFNSLIKKSEPKSFLRLESPADVYTWLEEKDYSNPNFPNVDMFEYILSMNKPKSKKVEIIKKAEESALKHSYHEKYLHVLSGLSQENLQIYLSNKTFSDRFIGIIIRHLDSDELSDISFQILCSGHYNKKIRSDKDYIEKEPCFLRKLGKENYKKAVELFNKNDIKFDLVFCPKMSKYLIEEFAKKELYYPNPENLLYIIQELTDEKGLSFAEAINIIYTDERFKFIKNYIKKNISSESVYYLYSLKDSNASIPDEFISDAVNLDRNIGHKASYIELSGKKVEDIKGIKDIENLKNKLNHYDNRKKTRRNKNK